MTDARTRILELSAVLEALRPHMDTINNTAVCLAWDAARALFLEACADYVKELAERAARRSGEPAP